MYLHSPLIFLSPGSTATPTQACPNNQIRKRCVKKCEESCHFRRHLLGFKENYGNEPCPHENCTIGCGCPKGLKNNGTHCIDPSNCDCFDFIDQHKHKHFRYKRYIFVSFPKKRNKLFTILVKFLVGASTHTMAI